MDGTGTGTENGATGAGRTAGRWLDVKEAATVLGISSDAVRKRISRGTLRSGKGEDGSVSVWLDGADDRRDGDQPDGWTLGAGQRRDGEELVEELRDRVRFLERQIEDERESRRRADTIIAQLTQANASLARRVPELEAPQEPRDGRETAAGYPDGAEDPAANGGPQEDAERPSSWWRRLFGG